MSSSLYRNLKSLKESVKNQTSGNFWLRYSTLAPYRALCAGASALTGLTLAGSRSEVFGVEQAVDYIISVFNMYKSSAGFERFHGRVAELGPGDSCGIGLMFLAHGCEEVDLVDRFFSIRNQEQQQAINRLLVQKFPQLASLLKSQDFSESSFKNLRRHYGESAAAETFFRKHGNYDFIVSCAVLEHAYDPLAALSATIAALNPGGRIMHQIDCRDHGQFSTHFHELKFLELPAPMYSPLKWRGGPNRVLLSSYLDILRRKGMEFTVYVNSLAGGPQELPPNTTLQQISPAILDKSIEYVSSVRNRLSKPFRDMSDEDLMVTRFVISAGFASS